jgi:hypothetical protein
VSTNNGPTVPVGHSLRSLYRLNSSCQCEPAIITFVRGTSFDSQSNGRLLARWVTSHGDTATSHTERSTATRRRIRDTSTVVGNLTDPGTHVNSVWRRCRVKSPYGFRDPNSGPICAATASYWDLRLRFVTCVPTLTASGRFTRLQLSG